MRRVSIRPIAANFLRGGIQKRDNVNEGEALVDRISKLESVSSKYPVTTAFYPVHTSMARTSFRSVERVDSTDWNGERSRGGEGRGAIFLSPGTNVGCECSETR